MVESTWNTRELPILEALATLEALNDSIERMNLDELVERSGVAVEAGRRAVCALYDDGFITGADAPSYGGRDIIDITLTGKGRRAVGSWPSKGDAYDDIIAAIDARIDDEPDPEKKSRLRKGAEGIGGMGRDLFVEIAATIISKQAGI